MNQLTAQQFQFPKGITLPHKQVEFCISVIDRYRKELPYLRSQTTILKRQKEKLEKEAAYWKEKYKEVIKKNEKLKKEIEKLTKTNSRYQVALFDHGNFKGIQEDNNKKEKGGQRNHPDTNREQAEDYRNFRRQRIFAKTCGKCHKPLPRVKATKQKILLDIIINPQVIKMILESERQWCSTCKHEVNVKDPRSLPFTEYGINTFMIVMILRFKCHASMQNSAAVITISHGLALSKSDVSNLLTAGARYLGKRYEELKKAIREGAIMYNDETGWLVHGQKAWMWIMANEKATVYVPAESRGKGIAEEMYRESSAYVMTDGMKSYTKTIPEEKHLYCWSHVLRFAFEETIHLPKEHPACQIEDSLPIRDRLVLLYQTIRTHATLPKEQKESLLRKELDCIVSFQSNDQTVNNIQYRIRTQKEGLIRALLITEDGTNNLSERELRNMTIKRTISHGSDTYKGMETTAIIGSVLQTLQRNKEAPFIPTLQTYLSEGIQEKHQQYLHTSYYDS